MSALKMYLKKKMAVVLAAAALGVENSDRPLFSVAMVNAIGMNKQSQAQYELVGDDKEIDVQQEQEVAPEDAIDVVPELEWAKAPVILITIRTELSI